MAAASPKQREGRQGAIWAIAFHLRQIHPIPEKCDFPFYLGWANENWSRRWDGSSDEMKCCSNSATAQPSRTMTIGLPALPYRQQAETL